MIPGIIKSSTQTEKPDDSHIFFLFRPIVWLWRKIVRIFKWEEIPSIYKIVIASKDKFKELGADTTKHCYSLENKNVISLNDPSYYAVAFKPVSIQKSHSPIFKEKNTCLYVSLIKRPKAIHSGSGSITILSNCRSKNSTIQNLNLRQPQQAPQNKWMQVQSVHRPQMRLMSRSQHISPLQ